ncbi:fatty acid desaturase family protein [Dactylosporangium sucinum]|uniref:fatty acid desaturase family protein n=1 Tax=Dactylosporangium sucinum TaxID=1424081 RepID=UPI00167C7460|nr:fatty acid desaturase [Dactylosporangium sucinum]
MPGRQSALSVALVGAALASLVLQLFVLPLVLLPIDVRWGWLLLPLALTTIPLWSLIHESIHGTLLRDRAWNDRLGRLLATGYGGPFTLLKAGHLLHHRYSRTPRERTEIYDPAVTSWLAAARAYYPRLLGGLYLAELVSIVLALVPAAGWRWLVRRTDSLDSVTGLLFERVSRREHLRRFRLESVAIVVTYTGSALAYGPHLWLLGVAVGVRALLVSLADNAYHYRTRLERPLDAMNLRLPRGMELFVLAFNLHQVHHRHPGLRWHELRAAFVADRDEFHLGWFTAVARQLQGPVPATAEEVRPLPAADRTPAATAPAAAAPPAA